MVHIFSFCLLLREFMHLAQCILCVVGDIHIIYIYVCLCISHLSSFLCRQFRVVKRTNLNWKRGKNVTVILVSHRLKYASVLWGDWHREWICHLTFSMSKIHASGNKIRVICFVCKCFAIWFVLVCERCIVNTVIETHDLKLNHYNLKKKRFFSFSM